MLLTRHIVLKDLRRLRPWLALLVAAILLRYTAAIYFSSLAAAAPEIIDRWDLREIADGTLLAVTLFSTALIAATLVHTDPLTGTKAFWITRPIAPARLLLAKILTLLLVLVLLPLLLQLAWWNLHDYSAAQIAAQLPVMLARHAGTAFAALFFALLTRNVGHFLLTSLLCTLAYAAMMAALAQLSPRSWIVHTKTWPVLTLTIIISGITAAILTQYLTRRTRLTVGIIASIFLLSFAVSALWRWPLFKPLSQYASHPRLTPDPDVAIHCNDLIAGAPLIGIQERSSKSTALHGLLRVRNIPAGSLIEFFEPSVSDPNLTPSFQTSSLTLESALDQSPTARTETFTISAKNTPRAVIAPGQTMTFPMLLRRVHVIARLPLEANAQACTGPYLTRVVGTTDESIELRLAPNKSVRAGGFKSLAILVSETCPSHLIDSVSGNIEPYSHPYRQFSYFAREGYLLLRDNKVISSLQRSKRGFSGNSISTDGVQYDRLTLRFPGVVITEADIHRYELLRVVAPAAGTFERTIPLPAVAASP